ncbi:hypothetical protein FS837_011499 [Tulasnella sp. UAMH 9824]|nr:hypothetical protein FS837_011499 [Tulasnella sp. UAMH 9824]
MSAPSKPQHEIALVESSDKELTQQCRDIRVKVFIEEQGFPAETEPDQYDEPGVSVHVLLRLLPSLEPVGCVRLVTAKGKVGRVCILKEYRKYGFGRDLLTKCHALAVNKMGTREFHPHSQIPAIPFYAKLGYVPVGDRFIEDGALFQKMVLTLPIAHGRNPA